MTSEENVTAYKEAYDAWQHHLAAMHEFFLDHKRIDPLHLKGVLTREARAKRKYDKARLTLLGIEEDNTSIDDGEDEDS